MFTYLCFLSGGRRFCADEITRCSVFRLHSSISNNLNKQYLKMHVIVVWLVDAFITSFAMDGLSSCVLRLFVTYALAFLVKPGSA